MKDELTIYNSLFPGRRRKKCLTGQHSVVEVETSSARRHIEVPTEYQSICFYCHTVVKPPEEGK